VSLRKREDAIELGIEDDGAGFDVNDPQSQRSGQGIGVSSMKERARLSGGHSQYSPGRGKEQPLLFRGIANILRVGF